MAQTQELWCSLTSEEGQLCHLASVIETSGSTTFLLYSVPPLLWPITCSFTLIVSKVNVDIGSTCKAHIHLRTYYWQENNIIWILLCQKIRMNSRNHTKNLHYGLVYIVKMIYVQMQICCDASHDYFILFHKQKHWLTTLGFSLPYALIVNLK